jgi:hypothetical protein
MSLNFLIAAPAHSTKSGGIMILHDLCTALNNLNYKAGIVFITGGSQDKQDFKFGYSINKSLHDPDGKYYDFISGKSPLEINEFVKNACIIYPDIIQENPLGSRFFATYVLGVPKTRIGTGFLISYFNFFIKNPNYILCKPFLSPFINDKETNHWSQRTLNLTYIGKGVKDGPSPVPGTILVERNWPSDKNQLGILLKNCKYFLTWDNLSATNFDAVLCGAVPVLMKDNFLPNDLVNQSEFGAFPKIDFHIDMDLRSTPNNILEIDSALDEMKTKIYKFNDSWLTQVSGLVTELRRFFNLSENKNEVQK